MRPNGRSQTAEKCFRHSEQMTEIVSGNSLRVPLTLPRSCCEEITFFINKLPCAQNGAWSDYFLLLGG